jgi:hypothetical protein
MNRGDHQERIFADDQDGAELGQAEQAKAQRLIAEALPTEGVTEEQVARWRKGHPFKIRLAARLRTETTVTVSWIAQRLGMGTRGHLAHLLHPFQQRQIEPHLPQQPTLNIMTIS